ncbi:hypothetical protein, conserved [Leishmania lindenbergi]|uniref:Secreted protein n=1 Tax=Leishmania lindenbergi TaxID=651832 RepID=A0AAW3AHN8_9TRYP
MVAPRSFLFFVAVRAFVCGSALSWQSQKELARVCLPVCRVDVARSTNFPCSPLLLRFTGVLPDQIHG